MKRAIGLVLAAAMAGLMATGCKPSYPKGSAEEAIVAICEKEYKVQVQVKTVGRTLGALVVSRNVLSKDLTLTDAALNKIENAMLTTTRVTLSSEFRYDFFVITVMDPATRVQVSFVRYLKDIRRLVMDDISRTEYFQRMLIDVKVAPPKTGSEEVYDLQEYRLEDFLARQVAERLKLQFQTSLIVDRLFHLAAVEGGYQPSRRATDGVFRMTLHFLPGSPEYGQMVTPALQEDFLKLVAETAGPIIRRYDFANYNGMEIVDGRNGMQLAFLDRQEFARESPLSTLMELIKSMKKK